MTTQQYVAAKVHIQTLYPVQFVGWIALAIISLSALLALGVEPKTPSDGELLGNFIFIVSIMTLFSSVAVFFHYARMYSVRIRLIKRLDECSTNDKSVEEFYEDSDVKEIFFSE